MKRKLFQFFRVPQGATSIMLVLSAFLGVLYSFVYALSPSIGSLLPIDSASIILLILASLSLHLFGTASSSIFSSEPESSDSQSYDLNTRLNALTHALNDAGRIISTIESEIESRQELVETLESQKAIAEEAITLSKEQVDAVGAILSQQVSRQSDKDSRRDLIRDFLFFAAGLLASLIVNQLGS